MKFRTQTGGPEGPDDYGKGRPPKGDYTSKAEEDRSEDIRRDTDEQENRSITLKDVDRAMLHQFKERFDLSITQNGEHREVPVIFDHPERWKWAANQDLKSAGDRILYPLLVINRESAQTDTARDIPNKGAFNMSPKGGNFVAKQRWSQNNRYDDFNALKDRVPSYEYYIVRVPNYIDVSYQCTLRTEYRINANTIQERVNYRSREYWGDPDRWLFWVEAGSFDQSVEGGNDEAQYVETTFGLDVKAYVLPEESYKEDVMQKMHTVSEVDFEEHVVTEEQFMQDD